MLLDEPFTGVDVKTEEAIINLLRELRDEGHIVLVSTHDLGSVPEFCDRVVIINRTVLAAGPTATTFTEANLARAFGGALRNLRLDHTDDPECNQQRIPRADRRRRRADLRRARPARAAQQATFRRPRMIDYLLTPFHYEYMVKAILVSSFIGGVCAMLSCFVTLKGWSLMGDALSHAIVPGVAIAYLIGVPFAVGAFASGLAAAARHGLDQSQNHRSAKMPSSASSLPRSSPPAC